MHPYRYTQTHTQYNMPAVHAYIKYENTYTPVAQIEVRGQYFCCYFNYIVPGPIKKRL